ncbi:zf-TFIIB domain-containing protein [bacterium]|nr:zf-TFIIB domain-containing protein [bacterium]
MKCPACRVPMYAVEFKQVEVDLCPDCGGVWFDRGELSLLLGVERPLETEPAATDEDARPCPLCDKTMDKLNIGPSLRVLVDRCPDCGMWFDRREVEDLGRDLRDNEVGIDPALAEFLNGVFPVKGDR